MILRNALCFLLVVLGLFQIIGHALGLKTLKGLGVVTTASPLPLVFTAVKGIETYASDFHLQIHTTDDSIQSYKITPEIYSNFNGPYNRRNIYGATFAYAPLLPDSLRNTVLNRAFCGPCFLKNDLLIADKVLSARITITPRTDGKKDQWTYLINCSR